MGFATKAEGTKTSWGTVRYVLVRIPKSGSVSVWTWQGIVVQDSTMIIEETILSFVR